MKVIDRDRAERLRALASHLRAVADSVTVGHFIAGPGGSMRVVRGALSELARDIRARADAFDNAADKPNRQTVRQRIGDLLLVVCDKSNHGCRSSWIYEVYAGSSCLTRSRRHDTREVALARGHAHARKLQSERTP